MRIAVHTAALLGFALIILGVSLWSVRAAILTAGAGLLAAGLLIDLDEK